VSICAERDDTDASVSVEFKLDEDAVFFDAEAPVAISATMQARETRAANRNLRAPLGVGIFILVAFDLRDG
jgi:hypothetical protein